MKQISITLIFTFLLASFSFAQEVAEQLGPKTTIEFEEIEFDWGTITQGDKASYVFKFTNTGNEPLIIKNAKGSCGCTVPQWPKAPIAPGEQGEIKVVFSSKGKMGKQSKRVTITANTDPGMSYLNLKGNIIKDEKADLEHTYFKGDDFKGVQEYFYDRSVEKARMAFKIRTHMVPDIPDNFKNKYRVRGTVSDGLCQVIPNLCI